MSKEMQSTHEGNLPIGDNNLSVAVLSDGTRVINQTDLFKAFGRPMRGSRSKGDQSMVKLPGLIDANNLIPFVSNELMSVINIIEYTDLSGRKNKGYNAVVMPLICDVYLEARNAKGVDGKPILTKKQRPNADAAEILVRALAKVGIIALVDEATNYQYDRERFELQKILQSYISDEIIKWQLTFTDDFYKEVFRLWGLPFIPKYIKNKPSFIGKLTTKYIYDELPGGVVERIKEKTGKTESGNWKYKWHQSLTPEIGREHLKKQIIEVTTLMSIAQSKEQFQSLFKQKYNKEIQLEMEFNEEIKEPKLNDFNKKLKTALDYNPKDKE